MLECAASSSAPYVTSNSDCGLLRISRQITAFCLTSSYCEPHVAILLIRFFLDGTEDVAWLTRQALVYGTSSLDLMLIADALLWLILGQRRERCSVYRLRLCSPNERGKSVETHRRQVRRSADINKSTKRSHTMFESHLPESDKNARQCPALAHLSSLVSLLLFSVCPSVEHKNLTSITDSSCRPCSLFFPSDKYNNISHTIICATPCPPRVLLAANSCFFSPASA